MEPRNTGVEPRKTRKARKKKGGGGEYEPRMDTNGHEWNHEIQVWNHERHEKESRGESMNHEWTRMDTNVKGRGNHEKHEIHEKRREGGESLNHEWTRMEPRNTGVEPRKTRKVRKRKKPVVGAVYEPRMHTNNRSRGKFPISAVPSFLLVPLTEKAVGFWVLPRGSTAFEMVCDAGLGPATSTVSG